MYEKQTEFFEKYSGQLYPVFHLKPAGLRVVEKALLTTESIITDELINEALDVNICVSITGHYVQLKYDTSLRLALAFRNIGYHWKHMEDAIVHNMRDTHGEELANKLKTTLELL